MLTPQRGRKTVQFRRHSIKDGPNGLLCGPLGISLAREVGEQQLRGRGFTGFFVSPLPRTAQTLDAFATGAEDFPAELVRAARVPPFNAASEMPQAMRLWEGPCRDAEQDGVDMLRACLLHNDLATRHVGRHAGHQFYQWFTRLPTDAHILVVGHSPFLELLALDLFNEKIPSLGFCDGIRFVEHDGTKYLETTKSHEDLNAEALRAQINKTLVSAPPA